MENAGAVCVTLAVAEAVGWLAPKDQMVRIVRALAALALVASVAVGFSSLDWDLSLAVPDQEGLGEDLAAFVQGEAEAAARQAVERYVAGLLAAAETPAEKIEAQTTILEDGSIECTWVRAVFSYDADARRALALLENVLGEGVRVEVLADGP